MKVLQVLPVIVQLDTSVYLLCRARFSTAKGDVHNYSLIELSAIYK